MRWQLSCVQTQFAPLFLFLSWSSQQDGGGGEEKKYPGITSPINLSMPTPMDLELSKKLEEAMKPYGVFDTEEDLAKRSVELIGSVSVGGACYPGCHYWD